MTKEKLIEAIKKRVLQRIPEEESNENLKELSLTEGLGFDSLDFIELIMNLESDLEIIIEDDKLNGYESIIELSEMIYKESYE